jgi:hypothetical protein
MPEIRNPSAPINAPTVPSAGSVTDPFSGSPFPRSTHPALTVTPRPYVVHLFTHSYLMHMGGGGFGPPPWGTYHLTQTCSLFMPPGQPWTLAGTGNGLLPIA